MTILSGDMFILDDYELLYSQCEIAVYHRINNYHDRNWVPEENKPMYAITYQGKLIEHLYINRLLQGSQPLAQLLATAYKELFYLHFAQGQVWMGRSLERALSMAYNTVVTDRLNEKCTQSNWAIKYNCPVSTGVLSKTHYSVECGTPLPCLVMFTGSKRIAGVTPTNGMQGDTRAFIELNIAAAHVWTKRGHNISGMVPTKRLVVSDWALFGHPLPTFDELVENNLALINSFIDQAMPSKK